MSYKWTKVTIMTVCTVGLIAVLGFVVHFKGHTEATDGGLPLSVKWGGVVHNKNFRDLGQSLNECLGSRLFAEKVVLRSNVWFSGWGCDVVGDPAVIYSLNFAPERHERYFCVQNDGKQLVGRHFNNITLNNLEFLATWENPAMVDGSCGFLREILSSMGAHQRLLIHCDAGRDRTGTVSALLAALAAERLGKLDDKMLDAIECDYRKTKSLKEAHYGQMKNFLQELVKVGGVTQFVQQKCHIPSALIQQDIMLFNKI